MSKAEKTRRFIIEQSAPLFNKKGIAGTSISDIMQATSLAKGGIYGNFSSKEEISVEVFDYMAGLLLRELEQVTAGVKSSTGKLYAILDFFQEYPLKPVMGGGCPILNFGTDADDTNPQIRKRVSEAILQMQQSIERLVQRGIGYGEFRPDWDGHAFAIRMFAMLEGGVLISRVQNSNQQMGILVGMLKEEIAAQRVS